MNNTIVIENNNKLLVSILYLTNYFALFKNYVIILIIDINNLIFHSY